MGLLNVRLIVFSLLSTALCAVACAGKTALTAPQPPADWRSLEASPPAPPSKPAVSVGRAYVEALSSPGFAALGQLLDDNAHFSFAASSDVLGRENVVRAHDALLGTFDDRKVELRRRLAADKAQVLEWTMTATQRSNRRPLVIQGVALLWVGSNGTLTDIHLYFDEAQREAQPGGDRSAGAENGPGLSVVREWLEALETKDEAAYLSAMVDDVELITPEASEPARGKAAARAAFEHLHGDIKRLDTQIRNAWDFGPTVVVEYRITGERRDRLLETSLVDVVEFRNGKIARVRRYDGSAR
jgi:ketosteroid isomerase-like protein